MQRRFQAIILAIILALAAGADAAVLYFGTDRLLRLGLGLLLLAPILWAGSRLGVVEHAIGLVSQPFAPRRFDRLRSRVHVLLSEIRRLNWAVVDITRGVRDREEAIKEIDAIEDHLKELIGGIRSAAGETDSQDEDAQGGDD